MAARTPVRIAYGNLVTPNATVTASSSATLFPVSLASIDFRGQRWRSTNDVSEYIQTTWSTAQTYNCMAILDHSLATSGTVELRGSNNNWSSFDTVVASVAVTLDPAIYFFASQSHSSIRAYFTDPSSTVGYIELGRLFIGTYVQPTRNYFHGWHRSKKSTSTVRYSLNQVPHFDRKPQRREPFLPFTNVTEADRDLISALVDEVDIVDPFLVVTDLDNEPADIDYVRLAQLPEQPNILHQRYAHTLQLVEAI